jgi:hypothetical protein
VESDPRRVRKQGTLPFTGRRFAKLREGAVSRGVWLASPLHGSARWMYRWYLMAGWG